MKATSSLSLSPSHPIPEIPTEEGGAQAHTLPHPLSVKDTCVWWWAFVYVAQSAKEPHHE